MTKLYIEPAYLENEIIPQIEEAIKQMNNAIYNVGELNIPHEFEHSEYLYNLMSNNKESRNQLSAKKDKIKEAIDNYKEVEQGNADNILLIKNVSVKLRNKFTK